MLKIFMKQMNKNEQGFSAVELVLVVIIVILVAAVGWLVYKNHHKTTSTAITTTNESANAPAKGTSNSSSTNKYAVLSPATVPSKTAECSQQLTTAADGSTGPITCSNGDLNVLEWNQLFKSDTPAFLTLGYNATEAQVQAAICSDVMNKLLDQTMVIEGNAYTIAALYYGWDFSTNPITAVLNSPYYNTGSGTC